MFAGRVPELRSVIECAFQMESPVLPTIEHYTAEDGYRCAVRVWRQDAPVARAVFLHGIISHGAWYASSSALLAAAGVEVHFIDRRGSGLNAVARGDVDQYLTWLRDVEVYLDRLSADAPRLLLGVSWGGKLAVAVARHRPDLVDGLALLCPGLFARQSANSVQRALLRCAAAAGFHGLRVTIPLRDPGLFTNSLPWQAYVRDDPLTLRKITIRFARADLDLNRYATQASPGIDIPTLLVLAGRDKIVDNRRVRGFVDETVRGPCQLVEYDNAAHTLEFEPDPQPYLSSLRDWARGFRS